MLHQLTLTNRTKIIIFIGAGYLFAGICIVVRPAGVFVLPAVLITISFIAFIFYKQSARFSYSLIIVSIAILCFIIPVLPQIILNWYLFNKLTFLPTIDLGSLQLTWGLQYLKYGTNVSSVGTATMFYPNDFFYSFQEGISPINWYIEHPLLTIKLFFTKFIGAFHFDYLYPYVDNLKSPLYPITTTISIAILLVGLIGVLVRIRKIETILVTIPIIISWCIITLPSALELRFSLPLLALFSIYFITGIEFIATMNKKYKPVFITILCLAFLICQSIGHSVFLQNSNFNIGGVKFIPTSINKTLDLVAKPLLNTPHTINIISDKNKLSAVKIKIGTYNRINNNIIVFNLYDDAGSLLRTKKVQSNTLIDNQDYVFKFKPIKNSKLKTYTFSVQSNEVSDNNFVALWYVQYKNAPDNMFYILSFGDHKNIFSLFIFLIVSILLYIAIKKIKNTIIG